MPALNILKLPLLLIGLLNPQRLRVDGEGQFACFKSDREWLHTRMVLTCALACRGLQWSE